MKQIAKILLMTAVLGTCFSCNGSKNDGQNKCIVLQWNNPDLCTNDNFFVAADLYEYCGRKQLATHHIDTLRCEQVEHYVANPQTSKVRIKLFITDLSNESQKEPLPLWVEKTYKFESDTLTINFSNTIDDYKNISPFKP